MKLGFLISDSKQFFSHHLHLICCWVWYYYCFSSSVYGWNQKFNFRLSLLPVTCMCLICCQVWLTASSQWHPWPLKVCKWWLCVCPSYFGMVWMHGHSFLLAKSYLFCFHTIGTWMHGCSMDLWKLFMSWLCLIPKRVLLRRTSDQFLVYTFQKDVRVLCVCMIRVFGRFKTIYCMR